VAIWKVYNIQSGQSLKAGFSSEDDSKEWLEKHRAGREDNYLCEEMDDDEEQEWLEAQKNNEDDDEVEQAAEEIEDEVFERDRYTYTTEGDDGEDSDPGIINELIDEDDDF